MFFYDFLVTGIPGTLTYKSEIDIKKGSLFYLKVRNKRRVGICIDKRENKPLSEEKILEIGEKDYLGLDFPLETLDLILWFKEYYKTSYDKTLQFFIPASLSLIEKEYYVYLKDLENLSKKESVILKYIKEKKKVSRKKLIKEFSKGVIYNLINLEKKGVIKKIFSAEKKREKDFNFRLAKIEIPREPTETQKNIINEILNEKNKKFFLIHGVTGSGKTFIYREIVKNFLYKGKKALVLVPEISLFPQIAPYFIFEKYKLFLYSFILKSEEKWNVLLNTLSEEPCVVLGARSSVFLPFKNLGVVIVDEEQEESYKEKEREPFYHVRDILIKRSEIEKVPLIFGTATPSLETYYSSNKKGKYFFIPNRISGYKNPDVEIVSLRDEPVRFYLSGRLLESIEDVLKKNKKVILFLNKRGFAHFIQCKNCGYTPICINCSISLTLYKNRNLLLCHYCGWKEEPPLKCPSCKSNNFKTSSYGTEKIEIELKKLFPERNIKRMDKEAISGRKKVFEVFESFIKGEIDILIGTKMIIKGLDNPQVGLASVLYADQEINFPDFRSKEKMFQRLTQLIGRVRKEGKTIIQTYFPEDKIYEKILNLDIIGFYEEELREREKLNYPPFSRLVIIESNTKINEDGEEILNFIKNKLKESNLKVEILGPVSPPIIKLKGLYRNRLLIKVKDENDFKKILNQIPEKLKIKIDLNPYDFL
ncbi:MAG: primosomal protein N' [Candidatus Hydrothermales bacterium]